MYIDAPDSQVSIAASQSVQVNEVLLANSGVVELLEGQSLCIGPDCALLPPPSPPPLPVSPPPPSPPPPSPPPQSPPPPLPPGAHIKFMVNLTLTECDVTSATFSQTSYDVNLASYLNVSSADVYATSLGVSTLGSRTIRSYVHLPTEPVRSILGPMIDLSSLVSLADALNVTCYGRAQATLISTTFPAPSPPPPSPPPPSPPPPSPPPLAPPPLAPPPLAYSRT